MSDYFWMVTCIMNIIFKQQKFSLRVLLSICLIFTNFSMALLIKVLMIMNCFCGMVDRGKVFSLISSRDHCQRFLSSRISDTPRAGFEPVQNLSSGFVEWSCAGMITTTPRRHKKGCTSSLTSLNRFSVVFSCVLVHLLVFVIEVALMITFSSSQEYITFSGSDKSYKVSKNLPSQSQDLNHYESKHAQHLSFHMLDYVIVYQTGPCLGYTPNSCSLWGRYLSNSVHKSDNGENWCESLLLKGPLVPW